MSGERTTLKAMIAVGLGFWLFGIAMTETWIICVAPVLVAWSVFHLLTDARSVTREYRRRPQRSMPVPPVPGIEQRR